MKSFKISKQKCLRTLKRYKSKPLKTSKNMEYYQFLEGVPCKKTRCLHQSMNGLEFDAAETMVGPGFKVAQNSEWSDACKTKVKRMKGLDLFKWVERVRKFYLTIGDIEKMMPGEKVDVVLLYPELFDVEILKVTRNKMLHPESLKKIAGTYVHKDGINGALNVAGGIIHTDATGNHLQVQIDKGWHNFYDGFLPTKWQEFDFKTDKMVWKYRKKMGWKDLPKSTPVGWRGPIIRVSDLKKMPMFYVYEEFV